MYTVRKKISVEYAHQLFTSYTNLCHETIHGHSGIIELFMSCDKLNQDGMVIDFGEISNTIKNKIMEHYDHALFMPKMFPSEYLDMIKKYNKRLTITDSNPTCEKFAEWIYWFVDHELKQINKNIKLEKVRFHETATGYAEYSSENV